SDSAVVTIPPTIHIHLIDFAYKTNGLSLWVTLICMKHSQQQPLLCLNPCDGQYGLKLGKWYNKIISSEGLLCQVINAILGDNTADDLHHVAWSVAISHLRQRGLFPDYPTVEEGGSAIIFAEKTPQQLVEEIALKEEEAATSKSKGKPKGKDEKKDKGKKDKGKGKGAEEHPPHYALEKQKNKSSLLRVDQHVVGFLQPPEDLNIAHIKGCQPLEEHHSVSLRWRGLRRLTNCVYCFYGAGHAKVNMCLWDRRGKKYSEDVNIASPPTRNRLYYIQEDNAWKNSLKTTVSTLQDISISLLNRQAMHVERKWHILLTIFFLLISSGQCMDSKQVKQNERRTLLDLILQVIKDSQHRDKPVSRRCGSGVHTSAQDFKSSSREKPLYVPRLDNTRLIDIVPRDAHMKDKFIEHFGEFLFILPVTFSFLKQDMSSSRRSAKHTFTDYTTPQGIAQDQHVLAAVPLLFTALHMYSPSSSGKVSGRLTMLLRASAKSLFSSSSLLLASSSAFLCSSSRLCRSKSSKLAQIFPGLLPSSITKRLIILFLSHFLLRVFFATHPVLVVVGIIFLIMNVNSCNLCHLSHITCPNLNNIQICMY
ncbi:hypothetical protein CCH79_00007106, partial [Gambusia affinis]